MFTRERTKHKLKEAGLSYRRAAPMLGVTYQHLSEVLNGHRKCVRLLLEANRLADLAGRGRA